ncbi:hypothetical protein K439DRAFT_1660100 [Ramaria rubella]|nr:hypothetical protein K439DRAFT_1660100 [Ramaria rubella]
MSSTTIIVQVISITFDVLGLAAILLLLMTVLFVKSLPQKENPFFVNFLLATLFTQIPPSLLFLTGHLGREPPEWLCSAQSILMDGVSPMGGAAWAVVVLYTWTDLKTSLRGEIILGIASPFARSSLLMVPYVAFLAWCLASLAARILCLHICAALATPPQWQFAQLVFCANESTLGVRVRHSISIYLLVIGLIQFYLEILIGRLIYKYWNTIQAPRTSFHFSLRVLVFCITQGVAVLFSIINLVILPNDFLMKQITQVLVSTNAFWIFMVFGTQAHVLRAWKFWDRRKTPTPPSDHNLKTAMLELKPIDSRDSESEVV